MGKGLADASVWFCNWICKLLTLGDFPQSDLQIRNN